MRKTDLAEIKKMDVSTLVERAKKEKAEIGKLLMEKNTNKMTNLKALTNKRKDLAQILTVKQQKQLLSELEKENGENKK